jgi:hypothetical protein
MAMLHNQAANLKNVIPENAVRYHSAMLEAKNIKTEATMNRVIHKFNSPCKVYIFYPPNSPWETAILQMRLTSCSLKPKSKDM